MEQTFQGEDQLRMPYNLEMFEHDRTEISNNYKITEQLRARTLVDSCA